MARPQLKLYVDIVSPFAYIAFYALHALLCTDLPHNFPLFKQCDVTYVPILLGGILNECGNAAPIMIKNKGPYINKERERWAKLFNIPIGGTPAGFPARTLPVQRALTAFSVSPYADKLPQVIDALYHEYWVLGKPIAETQVHGAAFAKVIGEEATKEMLRKANDKDVKDLLTKRTSTSVEEGAFGIPYFVATNSNGETDGFWGFSHLGLVVDHLGLERPTTGGWKALL
ncbi:thioredoxin-like protein [Eremomyces bilateralis CBS 781.70]|uniref:Glutathione S-transferase kappa n=1 Tax=Eremomyces bilateralis CBS 781.70 TaxID=1392243 RepID=A0A6G1GC46_9PEZI|nr:thioredoxin-like protein [Eremomyces bilateralis CBS 781.70]KAF1815471.1 thioredoxin-like protein [Eremomyces bilateralis CBS 781.70]